jgi:hypothetical protein
LIFLWFANVYFALTLIGLLPVIRGWEGHTLLRLRLFRYWIPIIPPWLIGGLAIIDQLLHAFLRKITPNRKTGVLTSFITLCVFSIIVISLGAKSLIQSPEVVRNGNDHFSELRSFLHKNGDRWDVIWTSQNYFRATERVIPMYTRSFIGKPFWQGEFASLNNENGFYPPETITSGIVIIDRHYMDPQTYNTPDYLFNPPVEWCLVFKSENERLYAYDTGCEED